MYYELEASELKWVNSDYILYGVNSLRLKGFLLGIYSRCLYVISLSIFAKNIQIFVYFGQKLPDNISHRV